MKKISKMSMSSQLKTEFTIYGEVCYFGKLGLEIKLSGIDYKKVHIRSADGLEVYAYILREDFKKLPHGICRFTVVPKSLIKGSAADRDTVLAITNVKPLKRAE